MRDRLLIIAAYGLCLAGIFVTWMLSFSYILQIRLPCGAGDGCTAVALSPAARVLGVPVPLFGLAFYLVLAIGTAQCFFRPPTVLSRAMYGLSLLGAAVSTGFTLYSFLYLQAECSWCIASNGIVCLLAVVYAFDRGGEPAFPKRWRLGVFAVPAALTLLAMCLSARHAYLTAERFPYSPEALARTTERDLIPDDAVFLKGYRPEPAAVMFLDPTCPACQATFERVNKTVSRRRIRLVIRFMPESTHPGSFALCVLDEEAALQGHGLDFLRQAMKEGPETREEGLELLQSVGGHESKAMLELGRQRVLRDRALADRLGLRLTPSIFVVYSDGDVVAATPSTLSWKLGHAG